MVLQRVAWSHTRIGAGSDPTGHRKRIRPTRCNESQKTNCERGSAQS